MSRLNDRNSTAPAHKQIFDKSNFGIIWLKCVEWQEKLT